MNDVSFPLTRQIEHFDVPDNVIYMANAARSILPNATIKAGQEGAASKGHIWRFDADGLFRQSEAVRAKVAAMIGADADDIAIQPSCAYGVATAAKNISVPPGSRILVIESQFPSNVYAWQDLADACSAEILCVPRPDDSDWTRAVLDHLDERIGLVALPPCHWTDGARLDLEVIGTAAHDLGALFFVDATQWLGAQPLNVKAIKADYVAAAGYKWMLGPYGLSFLYAAPTHHDGKPLEQHTNNHDAGAPARDQLGLPTMHTRGARRYDMGEYLSYTSIPMADASLDLIATWGPDRIGAYLASITDRIAAGARNVGCSAPPKACRSPHFIGIRADDGFPADTLEKLEAENIFVSVRGGCLRISPYLFNDVAQADTLLNVLEAVLGGR